MDRKYGKIKRRGSAGAYTTAVCHCELYQLPAPLLGQKAVNWILLRILTDLFSIKFCINTLILLITVFFLSCSAKHAFKSFVNLSAIPATMCSMSGNAG